MRTNDPIITLTTDFGLVDAYVAQMKGRILGICPRARIIDVTHLIPRHDVLAGSFALERALAVFPVGTKHVAVVDPGVGSNRKLLLAKINKQIVLCPDNGLITWPLRMMGGFVSELTWRPEEYSATFHGRDVLAPVAARLANGEKVVSFDSERIEPRLLDFDLADETSKEGSVIHIDIYGNATTNVPRYAVADVSTVNVAGRPLPILRTYSDVASGEPLALIGSSDLLEIAVREGSAADVLGLRVGDKVSLR